MSIREDVLKARYYLKDESGNVLEDWRGLCRRVSGSVARDEKEREDFFEVLHDCLFLPNSPALVNAGKKWFSLSACYVLPIEDSMESIFQTVKLAALVQKSGGGTGFSFSRLRPAGDVVGSTKGLASGPGSFIRVYDTTTDVLKQGGVRRGANMGVLRVDHPDIMEFIALKRVDGKLPNFNLSVGITDQFMKAVKTGEDFDLVFGGQVRKTLNAREVYDAIIDCAWENGEPGLVFLDRMNRDNPTPHVGEFEATNPCGEQPLLPYEACTLGSINLSKMVDEGIKDINYGLLELTVRKATRFLDNIIDIQDYPVPEIEQMHKGNRKIGLGVMGWADALIKLAISYNSEGALTLTEELMKFIKDTAISESTILAEKRGPFPNWEGSLWQQNGIKVRNASMTTIAPTGSISIIAECSSGIEPIFDFVTEQERPVGKHKVIHPLYEKWTKKNEEGKLPPHFVTARDISPEWHIRMQAAFQKNTHAAVSKTINLPGTATRGDIENAFLLAHELGCKGITVYRDGTRKNQVLSSVKTDDGNRKQIVDINGDRDLPAVMDSKRICVETSEGKVYVHISLFQGKKPLEVFITTPIDSKYSEVYESFARIFSVALRQGIDIEILLSQLEKANRKYGSVASVPAAMIRAFRMVGLSGGQQESCPDCGGVIVLEEGCLKCLTCGFSMC